MKKSIEFKNVTTRGGDGGETSLFSGDRCRKDDRIFDVLGDLDELNCFLGLVRTMHALGSHAGDIEKIQNNLFRIGAEVATPPSSPLYEKLNRLTQKDVEGLEETEKFLLNSTPISPVFVVPGTCEISARIDVARAVCRRAERHLVSVIRERGATGLAVCQHYINRLSDYLFILARKMEKENGL